MNLEAKRFIPPWQAMVAGAAAGILAFLLSPPPYRYSERAELAFQVVTADAPIGGGVRPAWRIGPFPRIAARPAVRGDWIVGGRGRARRLHTQQRKPTQQ